jgi:hypothetical protein
MERMEKKGVERVRVGGGWRGVEGTVLLERVERGRDEGWRLWMSSRGRGWREWRGIKREQQERWRSIRSVESVEG